MTWSLYFISLNFVVKRVTAKAGWCGALSLRLACIYALFLEENKLVKSNNILTSFKSNRALEKMTLADSRATPRWLVRAVTVAILVLPFFVFYWMVPFIGKHTIGNDYVQRWFIEQLYLHFSVRNGTFPLYAPGFAEKKNSQSTATINNSNHLETYW